jgi:hypothetical protein
MGGKKGCKPELCPHGTLGKGKCRVCKTIRDKEYRKRHPDRSIAACKRWRDKNRSRTRAYRRRRLGIPVHDGKARIGICPMCKKEGTLVPDHCHVSGKMREWLCGTCNRLLGIYETIKKDGRLKLFEEYLEKYDGK